MWTLKHVGAAAIATLFALAITADSADARGGGFHGGGGMRAGGGFRGGANFGGRAHVSHPIARPGRPGWGGGGNWAGRPGYGYGGYRPGYGYALGAAAVGAGLAYGAYSNCEYYGNCGGGYYESGYSEGGVSDDGVAYCAQRFRTYDVASQTYVGKGGRRISCP